MEYLIREISGKKILVVDCGSCVNNASLGNGNCFKCVMNLLKENEVDELILRKLVDKHLDTHGVAILKDYARFLNGFEIKEKICKKCESKIMGIIEDIHTDPISCYFQLVSFPNIKCKCESMNLIKRIKEEMSKTTIIKLARKFGNYRSREIYHIIFKYEIKPSFISSFIFLDIPDRTVLLEEYQVMGASIKVFKSEEMIEPFYFIFPPEMTLNADELGIIGKTLAEIEKIEREIEPEKVRDEMEKIVKDKIKEIAPNLTKDKIEKLSNILIRYSVGYGILEILFADENLQDIYVDSPGNSRVHVYHQKYEECVTNIILSKEDLEKVATRIRAFSGRPFDEAYPSIDSQIKEYKVRVCGVCEPLTFSGVGFAFRKHKEKAWTLPKFIEAKMLNAACAGLLNFLLQSEVSILITGTRGSGKTSLLSALLCEIPPNYRIIVIEDTPELPIDLLKQHGYKIQHLRVKQVLGSDEYELTPEQALRTALRLGESVLVIGEVRSKEARALFEAMRIGAIGNVVLGTIHGSSVYDVYDRIVNDLDVPKTSFKATDIVISCASLREREGIRRKRRVINVCEVGKFWNEDPLRENGFADLMKYDSLKDKLVYCNLKNSFIIKRICELRGMKLNRVIQSIKLRAMIKEAYVKSAKKFNKPELLNVEHVIAGNKLFLNLIEEKKINYCKIYRVVCNWLKMKAKSLKT